MNSENQLKLEALRAQFGKVIGGELEDGTLVAVKAPPRGAWKLAVDAINKGKGDTDSVQYQLVLESLVAPALPSGKGDAKRMHEIVDAAPGVTQKLFDACAELAKGGFDLSGN